MISRPPPLVDDGRVGALVEQDRVVLDVAVVAEAEVRNTAAVTRAHVAAHPVVVELVVVGCRCRRSRRPLPPEWRRTTRHPGRSSAMT